MPKQLKHRSRSEVISSILEATNGNKLGLVHLLPCDLIEYIEGERKFKTTPKGMQVLQTYNKMEELFVKSL